AGCPCYSHGTDFSQPEGKGSLGVLVVAEASGESEAREGLPLRPYAPAGSLFERAIRRLSFSREQFTLTNVVRCHPRNNFLDGAPWERAAVEHCRPNLDAVIQQSRPRVILTLGNVALSQMTGMAGPSQGISHLRGYPMAMMRRIQLDCEDCQSLSTPDPTCFDCGGTGKSGTRWINSDTPIVVMPTYHPSFIRRGAAHLTGVFMRDIQRAVMVANGRDKSYMLNAYEEFLAGKSTLKYQTRPSYEDAWSFYYFLKDNPQVHFAYDLETVETLSLDEDAREQFADTEIRTVQFCHTQGTGISMPWVNGYRKIVAAI